MNSLSLLTIAVLILTTVYNSLQFQCLCNHDTAYKILTHPAPLPFGTAKFDKLLPIAYNGNCFFYNGTYVAKNETFFKTDVNGQPGWFWYNGYADLRIENCSNPIRDKKEGANCLLLLKEVNLYGRPNLSEDSVISLMRLSQQASTSPHLLSIEPFQANNHSWYNVTYFDELTGYVRADNPHVIRWHCDSENEIKIPVWEIAVISGIVVIIIIALPSLIYILYKRRSELHWIKPNEEPYADTEDNAEHDVFISYSTADIEWIRDPLFTNLRNKGYNVCIDFKDFIPGTHVAENIMNSICQSRKTIVVISRNFLHSVWGQFELQQALHKAIAQRKNTLIIIKYGKCKIPRKLMGKIFLDWTCEKEKQFFWKRLFESIGKPMNEIPMTVHI